MMLRILFAVLLLLTAVVTATAQAPTAPSGLTVTNGSGNNINLSWTDNASTETGFKVERKLGVSGSYSQIDTVGANVTTYADTSAKTANRPYIYRVRATNGSGDSAYTGEDDATTPFLGTTNYYRTDAANYTETPTTMPLPLAGGKFYDETFGTEIMRFTDEGDGETFSTNYSVWPTPNSNNTKLFLFNLATNNYFIGTLDPATFSRTGSLQLVANPPATIFSHLEALFWSFTDPDKAFVTVDAKLYYYRPSTNSYTLVKDLQSYFGAGWYFNQLYVSDDDNRFAALMKNASGDQGFMVWEQSTDTLKLDVRTTDMNGITMDKGGDYVLYVANTPFVQGIYNVNTGAFDALVSNPTTGLPDYQIGHNDTGHDLVVSDDQWRGGFTSRRMSTPHTITLAYQYAPYWFSHHVSGRADNEFWNLVSTYGASAVSADPNKYSRELLQIGVQAPFMGSIRRLAHTRSVWEAGGIDTVTGATNASPIVITTSAAHGLRTGQRLFMSGIGGNTAANGTFFITVLTPTTFSLNGSTGNGTYTSGGQAYMETYWDTPRANISRDGKFVFFTSNWNGVPGGGRTDLFIARIIPAQVSPSVTLITANLQHGQGTDLSFNFQRQVDAIVASGASIAAVQERSSSETGWNSPLSAAGWTQAVYLENNTTEQDGPALWVGPGVTVGSTFTRALTTGTNPSCGSPNVGWDCSTDVRKSAVAAQVTVSGIQFLAVSVHGCWSRCNNSSGSILSLQRENQMNDLVSWIASIRGGLDVVVLGDFNFAPNTGKTTGGLIKDILTAGYTDLWNAGLTAGTATALWGDRNADGIADMPVSDLTTRTHDSRRIDYIFLSTGATLLTFASIDLPDNRAVCTHALVAGGTFPSCSPEVNGGPGVSGQQWDFPDDFGVRPSDHNFLKVVLNVESGSTPMVICRWNQSPVCQ